MKNVKHIIYLVLILGLIIIGQNLYHRWDVTEDNRFSFSEFTQQAIDSIQSPTEIHVFLEGELTGEFRVLKNEIQFFLNELNRENPLIQYQFINPIEQNLDVDSLKSIGVSDISIPTQGKILRAFPFATIEINNQVGTIPLLSNKKIPVNQRATASLDLIESKFMKELYRLGIYKKKKIGLIVHHDELLPNYIQGMIDVLDRDYQIIPYTLPITSGKGSLQLSDLDSLKTLDALVIAKPIKPFSDTDKLVLDQYLMNGGKTLWMTENVDAEMDSLFRSDKIVSFPRETKTSDLLFAYGVRILPAVVKDLQSGFITLAIGQTGTNTAYEQFPWPYFPLSIPNHQHSITKKIANPLRFEFANPIEILPRDSVKAEMILSTSPNVQLQKSLSYIDFSEIQKVNSANYPAQEGVYPLAVLLEGKFPSAYKGRIESKEVKNFKSRSVPTRMMVISDGDFAKNHIFRGEALPLGADKYSLRPDIARRPSVIYGNGEFLLNSLDYLTGNETMIALNEKERKLHLLNQNLVKEDKNSWRWLNILFPAAFILFLAWAFIFWRKRKHSL